ncbi:TIR domain-containing protein [Tumebacillus lipolyticus]|uniref:TIR domain-containing protein n=1 Tax=Tumebacillus lipolyticus TaxID=1280370 RepID=A0ABW4ZWE1_9BACL
MAKNLFISHSWTYSDTYDGLVKLLNAGGFDFKNYSVPKNDPIHNASNDRELYEAIKKQISPSSVVIILAGVYASYSKWINHEIDIAKNGFATVKPILAIEPFGSERTSKVVKDAADLIVKWNTNSIISGIEKLTK